MSADELRRRVDALGLTQREMAERLGLSVNGLFKQLTGERKVSRQTEIILDFLEGKGRPLATPAKPRRTRSLAKYLY